MKGPSPLGLQVNKLLDQGRTDDAARIATKAFQRPPRFKVTARQQEVLDAANLSSIDIDGLSVRLYIWPGGDTTKTPNKPITARTILLTHGFSTSAALLTPLISYMLATTSYRIVALDHAGHGASEGSLADLGVFIRTLQRLILDEQNQPLKAVVGHSVGATATIMALADLNNTRGHLAIKPKLVLLDPPLQPTTLMVPFCRGHGIPEQLATHMRKALIPSPEDVLQNQIAKRISSGTEVLLVQDKDDPVALMEQSKELKGDLESVGVNVRLFITERLGHFKGTGDESVHREILQFLGE